MVREIRLRLENWSIKKGLFTWNGKSNTESVGYEIIKKAAIPKTTRWCPLLRHFLPGNNIRPESKIIIIVIIIIIIVI